MENFDEGEDICWDSEIISRHASVETIKSVRI
jgi:hypothetical protein